MSADWQVGDLALCVDNAPREGNPKGAPFAIGAVLRVSDLHLNSRCLPCLIFDGRKGVWRTDRFRKIRPDEHEACEPEFVTLLKRRKVSA